MSWYTATGMDSAIGKQNDEDLRRMMVATGNLLRVQHKKTLLKAFVKEELFPRCKFLQLEDLATNGLISKKVRKHLNYKRDEWEQPWNGCMGKKGDEESDN
jgi:hypothetical protein